MKRAIQVGQHSQIANEITNALDDNLAISLLVHTRDYTLEQLRSVIAALESNEVDDAEEHGGVRVLPVLFGMELSGVIVKGMDDEVPVYLPIMKCVDPTLQAMLEVVRRR